MYSLKRNIIIGGICAVLLIIGLSFYLFNTVKNKNDSTLNQEGTSSKNTSNQVGGTEPNWPTQNGNVNFNTSTKNTTNTQVTKQPGSTTQNTTSQSTNSNNPTNSAQNTGDRALRAYFNAVGTAYENYYAAVYVEAGVVNILATSSSTTSLSSDKNVTQSLNDLVNIHNNFTVSLKQISVPQDMINTNNKLITASENFTMIIQNMATTVSQNGSFEKTYFKNYNDAVIAQANAITDIASAIKNSSLTFSDTENASFIQSFIP